MLPENYWSSSVHFVCALKGQPVDRVTCVTKSLLDSEALQGRDCCLLISASLHSHFHPKPALVPQQPLTCG